MKRLSFILLMSVISCNLVFADSINPAVYKTMSGASYRNNYRLNTQTQPTPYWKQQANPASRINDYTLFNNQTQNYNQDMSNYKYNMKLMRGY